MISKKEFIRKCKAKDTEVTSVDFKSFRKDVIGNPIAFKRYIESTMLASGIQQSGDPNYRPNAFWSTDGDLIVSVSQPTNNTMPRCAMNKFKADVEDHYEGKVEVTFLVNTCKEQVFKDSKGMMAGTCTAINSPKVAFRISPKQ